MAAKGRNLSQYDRNTEHECNREISPIKSVVHQNSLSCHSLGAGDASTSPKVAFVATGPEGRAEQTILGIVQPLNFHFAKHLNTTGDDATRRGSGRCHLTRGLTVRLHSPPDQCGELGLFRPDTAAQDACADECARPQEGKVPPTSLRRNKEDRGLWFVAAHLQSSPGIRFDPQKVCSCSTVLSRAAGTSAAGHKSMFLAED